jgi:putative hydrolases of HD superfamily
MRQESVAEHSWRLCVLSWLISKEFPDYNMDKVLIMCLFHDLGEAITGDIPAFLKTQQQENDEVTAIDTILKILDDSTRKELNELFIEMQEQRTKEAKLFKALDKLEAVIQHNEAPLSSWIPLEYELNLTYGDEEVKHSTVLQELRNEIRNITVQLISEKGTEQNT